MPCGFVNAADAMAAEVPIGGGIGLVVHRPGLVGTILLQPSQAVRPQGRQTIELTTMKDKS